MNFIDIVNHFRRGGLPFDGPIDVDYFCDIPNEATARDALAVLSTPGIEVELNKRHPPSEVARLWKAMFRGCVAHGVPVPDHLKGYARRLGIVFPE